MRPERFAAIRRRGELGVVLEAMDAAEAAGLRPVKVNVVLLRGENDDEILDFAGFARDTGRVVRFIEFMPLDAEGDWDREPVVPAAEVYDADQRALAPRAGRRVGRASRRPNGSASPTGVGEIGVDRERHRAVLRDLQPAAADRRRGGAQLPVLRRRALRARPAAQRRRPTPTSLVLLRRAVWGKLPGHGINEPGFLRPARSMSMIGG